MYDILMRSDIVVKLIDCMASDLMVTRAAQVSIKGENNPETDSERLINYLMTSRHGTPFEHNAFTFFVEAPIFVFREWQRHRIGSFNEMSGRYTKLNPHFYTPSFTRNLINTGTSARPEMGPGTRLQSVGVAEGDLRIAKEAWETYEERLQSGIANEIARTVLPLNVYSQMYWTVNARALMNFLSLRTDARSHGLPDATIFSRPQREIEIGAEHVESYFAQAMPHTHAAFVKAGRIAP